MGYGAEQIRDLEATVRATPCDLVVVGTPVDLRRLIHVDKPAVRVTYRLAERGDPDLAQCLARIGATA
jgi:predicted GTPase